MREKEVRILEIDINTWVKMLEDMGAVEVGNWLQKRYVYDFQPKVSNKWIRLRTNGIESTLAIKEVVDSTKVDGTKELEIAVSDFDKTNAILKELGYTPRALQENKRIRYVYQNIEIDIDTWPFLPTYVEIEGPSVEAVENFLSLVHYDEAKLTTLDVDAIYRSIYHINPDEVELKFSEDVS